MGIDTVSRTVHCPVYHPQILHHGQLGEKGSGHSCSLDRARALVAVLELESMLGTVFLEEG